MTFDQIVSEWSFVTKFSKNKFIFFDCPKTANNNHWTICMTWQMWCSCLECMFVFFCYCSFSNCLHDTIIDGDVNCASGVSLVLYFLLCRRCVIYLRAHVNEAIHCYINRNVYSIGKNEIAWIQCVACVHKCARARLFDCSRPIIGVKWQKLVSARVLLSEKKINDTCII